MKQRDDTKPQAVIIDTTTLSLKFDDFLLYAMSEKQSQALEYAKEIIAQNPNGISRHSLIDEIRRRAKLDEIEVIGASNLRKFLLEFDGKFFRVTNGNDRNALNFYPLLNS